MICQREGMLEVARCTCPEESENPYTCLKHDVHLCEECLTCQDPSGYCKFRTACPIWFIQKHPQMWGSQEKDQPGEDP